MLFLVKYFNNIFLTVHSDMLSSGNELFVAPFAYKAVVRGHVLLNGGVGIFLPIPRVRC